MSLNLYKEEPAPVSWQYVQTGFKELYPLTFSCHTEATGHLQCCSLLFESVSCQQIMMDLLLHEMFNM